MRNAIAAAALVLFAACLALMVVAGQRKYATIGPSRAFAMQDGTLFLVSHGKLHRFGGDGMRRQVIDLAELGVPPRPSDFEMHRDGRLVITDPDRSVLHRCTLPKGPCEILDVDLTRVPAQEILPLNAAKIHIAEEAKRYYVSDNYGHRVIIADFDGKVLYRHERGSLRHPNHLWLRAPGELAVVETDFHRIVTVNVAKDTWARTVGTMPAGTTRFARPGRMLPFDALQTPSGETWVLIARHHMQDADLIVFDASGKATRRIDLGEDSDPFDIEMWRGKVWVADATRYRFEPVGLDGARGQLEDREFLDELDRERRAPQLWGYARTAGQLGVVLVPLIAALALWKARPGA